eukprot:2059210-Amphidinium_carterae.2
MRSINAAFPSVSVRQRGEFNVFVSTYLSLRTANAGSIINGHVPSATLQQHTTKHDPKQAALDSHRI